MVLIFDLDAGHDPDDTGVVLMLAWYKAKGQPIVTVSNDETTSGSRARWMKTILDASQVDIPVVRGLPAKTAATTTLVEEVGLVQATEGVEQFSYLEDVARDADSIQYIGLGALTNLAYLLKRQPSISDKIELTQMGPSLHLLYRKVEPQYNVRLDPEAFRSIFNSDIKGRYLLSHTSWMPYDSGSKRQQLGIYPDDPLFNVLAGSKSEADVLFARHLQAWYKKGLPCSIMHDPLTVLSVAEPIVHFEKMPLQMSESGLFDTDPKITERIAHSTGSMIHSGRDSFYFKSGSNSVNAFCSISADINHARRLFVQALGFSDAVAEDWTDYNKKH